MRRLSCFEGRTYGSRTMGLADSGTHRFVATVVATRCKNYCTSKAQGHKKEGRFSLDLSGRGNSLSLSVYG
jgi:hypothetical protein